MFEYIENSTIRNAVSKGYKLCYEEGNYPAFVKFLDALDIPASISMRVIVDVLKRRGPQFEGLERGLKELLTDAGKQSVRTVHITTGDDGLKDLDFSAPVPYHSTFPIVNGQNFCKLECYSILGRTPSAGNGDGNPLIYALKRINNWRLASASDFRVLLDYFVTVCEKEFGTGMFSDVDILIPVPSTAKINLAMVNCIKRRINPSTVTLDSLKKQSVDHAYAQMDESLIDIQWMPKLYPDVKRGTAEYFKLLESVISDLDESRKRNTADNGAKNLKGNPFSIKYVHPKYRELFDDYLEGAFPDGILDDKNVLVVDDSISTGTSLTNLVKKYVLQQQPKSVKALTLLSPLLK